MIIHFDCKNCDEPVQEHCADCYACFNGDSGHGLDCDRESISFFVSMEQAHIDSDNHAKTCDIENCGECN